MNLTSKTAKKLQDDVHRTAERLMVAQKEYDSSMSTALDTQFSADGSKALQIASRNYRAALQDHSEAIRRLADFVLGR